MKNEIVEEWENGRGAGVRPNCASKVEQWGILECKIFGLLPSENIATKMAISARLLIDGILQL